MDIVKIEAYPRSQFGKGPAAKLRREGRVPAVAYGKDLATEHLAVTPKELLAVLNSAHGKNSVIELTREQESPLTVLVRDYDYHPLSRALTHIDFVQVRLDQEVDVEVPFLTTGKAAGITLGGVLRIVYRSLPVRCLPEKIPMHLDHDITSLGVNESVKVSHLKLPEGVKVRLPDEQTVAAVVAPEKERPEDAVATGAAPGAPAAAGAAAGAAAAPAAKKDDKAAAAKPAAKDAKKKLSAKVPPSPLSRLAALVPRFRRNDGCFASAAAPRAAAQAEVLGFRPNLKFAPANFLMHRFRRIDALVAPAPFPLSPCG